MVLNHPEHKCFDLSDDSFNVDLSLDDFLLDSFYGEFLFKKIVNFSSQFCPKWIIQDFKLKYYVL